MRAERLSREFAAALAHTDPGLGTGTTTGSLLGVEHEFRVHRDGAIVHFAPLLASLHLGRLHLDPGDVNARRLASGAAVTCDGSEAEIALPPVAVGPGFTAEVVDRADAEMLALHSGLGAGTTLQGTSTHVSVAVDGGPDVVDAVAAAYARTYSAALMLLLDRTDSYGVYVRPRPGRLELCGEYVRGSRLGVVAAFAAGTVSACADAVLHGRQALPPLRVAVAASTDRYGYLVHRHAFGGDLYREGPAAWLATENGPITAAAHLRSAWTTARAQLEGRGCHSDVAAVEAFLATTGRLPVHLDDEVTQAETPVQARAAPPPAPCGRLAATIRRPRYDMAAVMLTWDAAVLVASRSRRRHAFLTVPRTSLDTFLTRLDAGELDDVILAFLRGRSRGRALTRREQVLEPGLFDILGNRRALLAAEVGGTVPGTAAAA